MREPAAHATAWAVVALALGAASIPAFSPGGAPILAAVPDGSWTVRGPATLSVGDGATEVSAPARAVLARPIELPAGTWMVRAELERVTAGQGSRLFLSTPEPRWAAARGPGELGAGAVVEVVAADVPAGPAEVGVVVRPGEGVRVRRIEVLPARSSWLHAALRWGAVGAAAAGVLAALLGLRRTHGAWPVLALGGAVLAGVLAPRDRLDAALLLVPGTTPADLHGTLLEHPTLPVLVQKLGGHALGFALLGVLGRVTGVQPAVLLARLLSFAAATEALQLLVPDRSGRFADVALDVGGGLLGAALVDLTLRCVAALRAPPASAASRP